MSKLEELIQEFCPDGVNHIAIGQLIKQKRIVTITPSIKIKRNDYLADGATPIISQEAEYISGYCNLTDKNILKDNYVCFGDHSEHIKFIDFAFVQGADGLKIMRTDETVLSARYLFHAASNFYCRHNNYERHFKYFTDTIIPLPPLAVQQEIVRVLDSFTELTAELTAELSEELTARRKQYEYYRNIHLCFDENTPKKKLKDISVVFRGEYTTKAKEKTGNIPVILGGQEPAYFIDRANHDGEVVVVARSGASAGFVSYWNKPIFITDGFGYEAKTEIVTSKFLYYIMKNREKELNALKRGAGVPHVSGEALSNLLFPIPPIEKQKYIVHAIESFATLCTGLTISLPAEIATRQKQYEYYRDKLLTFNEMEK